MEKYLKFRIEFNSQEYIDILLDQFGTSTDELKAALEEFKTTTDYENDLWDEDDLINFLIESNINIIPLNIGITERLYVPDGNNK